MVIKLESMLLLYELFVHQISSVQLFGNYLCSSGAKIFRVILKKLCVWEH